jgi:hypothetical protein
LFERRKRTLVRKFLVKLDFYVASLMTDAIREKKKIENKRNKI